MMGRELAGGGGGGGGNLSKKIKSCGNDQHLDSVFASAPSDSFLGPGAMLSFRGVGGVNGSGNSFYQSCDLQEKGDEYLDDYISQPEKKRRQIKSSFLREVLMLRIKLNQRGKFSWQTCLVCSLVRLQCGSRIAELVARRSI